MRTLTRRELNRALLARQFYVGNTRYRGSHRIYVSHREPILNRLALGDPGRELATEFVRRQNVTQAEEIAMRPLRRMGERVRRMWRGMAAHWEHVRETMRERNEP